MTRLLAFTFATALILGGCTPKDGLVGTGWGVAESTDQNVQYATNWPRAEFTDVSLTDLQGKLTNLCERTGQIIEEVTENQVVCFRYLGISVYQWRLMVARNRTDIDEATRQITFTITQTPQGYTVTAEHILLYPANTGGQTRDITQGTIEVKDAKNHERVEAWLKSIGGLTG